jgi:hypothetical protein
LEAAIERPQRDGEASKCRVIQPIDRVNLALTPTVMAIADADPRNPLPARLVGEAVERKSHDRWEVVGMTQIEDVHADCTRSHDRLSAAENCGDPTRPLDSEDLFGHEERKVFSEAVW